MRFDTDSYPIVIDTGCSRSVSSYLGDFVATTLAKPIAERADIQGIAGATAKVELVGTIIWKTIDDEGKAREVLLPNSLYVPNANVRLLSPQHMAQSSTDEVKCTLDAEKIVLSWGEEKSTKTVPIKQRASNVATLWAAPGYEIYKAFVGELRLPPSHSEPKLEEIFEIKGSIAEPADSIMKIDEKAGSEGIGGNQSGKTEDYAGMNIKDPMQLKLLWHYKLGHISMNRLDVMAKLGWIPKIISTCSHPVCKACIYGKMTKKPWRTKPTNEDENKNKQPIYSKPGQMVSVDQLESQIPGLIGQVKGRLTKKRYHVATVFVDHYSSLSYIYLQQSTTAKETVQAKVAFEEYAASFGVKVLKYKGDNGRFADNDWKDHIKMAGQQLIFSGVGAHHQNGSAEKRIRDLQDLARSSIIHANNQWPEAVTTELWPYALRHANVSINMTPFPGNERTPLELFSGVKAKPSLVHAHPFGCPAYVLAGPIQAGHKPPKWDSKARLGIYIGPSPQHARSVGLVLSLTTAYVSPQFHVRYDDTFETVANKQKWIMSRWQSMAGFSAITRKTTKRTSGEVENAVDLPLGSHMEVNTYEFDAHVDEVVQNPTDNPTEEDTEVIHEVTTVVESDDDEEVQEPPPPEQGDLRATRSGRTIRSPRRYRDYVAYSAKCKKFVQEMVDQVNTRIDDGQWDDYIKHSLEQPLFSLAASSDPDVLYLHEALKAPDSKEFIKAMVKEVQSHIDNENWEVVNRKDIPKGKSVVPSVWAMRRKRDIVTREVYKWKARLNFHGGKQTKGVDFWETYAPVASWPAIRIIMLMAIVNGWITRQLDFVLAFPQAPVETELYMAIPPGFEVEGSPEEKALRLRNNLYGQKQAGRVWNKFLTQGLKKIGFIQSSSDECIFWRGTVIIVIYTDDTIVTGPNIEEIDQAIKEIGQEFQITHQERVNDFLGVKIQRNEGNGSATLTQPQLIDSILNDLNLSNSSNTRDLPALTTKVLHAHESSEEHNEEWSYRSVVGKLNYLSKSTRPDIEFAVHQCARFSAAPKVEHTKAIKLIGRYLLGTKDKGLIYRPKAESIHCYVDADFAGAWEPSIAETDSSTARSRTGFVIKYAGCSVIWGSRLQTEIALSSTESEYIALSQSLREVIPMIRLLRELKGAGFDVADGTPEVHCTVFEDNNGALEMARTPKMRPRTKHLNIKYHHFRSHVESKEISIHPIDTLDQQADVMTKPLGRVLFEKFRLWILGW